MNRMKIIMAATIVLAAVVVAIFYFKYYDPTTQPLLRCLFKALTGLNCPGCGSQRALHALLNGRFNEAWQYNSFIFIASPIALLYIIVEACPDRFSKLYRLLVNKTTAISLLLLTIALFVIIN
jgi:hypothetical protein